MSAPTAQTREFSALETQYLTAEQLLLDGRVQEAAKACQQLVMGHPNYPDGYFLMGKLFSQVGNHAKAIEHISKAISLSACAEPAYLLTRGHMHLILNENEEAARDLSQSITLNDQHGMAHLLLGAAYTRLGRIPEARNSLQKAHALGLEADANEQLGMLLQAERRYEEALELFENLIRARPQQAMGFMHRGNLYLEMGDLDAAKIDAEKAIALENTLDRGWLLLALVQYAKGDYANAAFAVERSVALKPEFLQNWHLMASSLMQLGRLDSSVDIYKEILRRSPEDAVALNYLPSTLMALGRVEEARDYIAQALANDPNNPVMRHFDAAARGEALPTANADYVRLVFDGYADHFDESLQKKLHYQTPDVLASALRRVMKVGEDAVASLSLLDLGCGTGLGAIALQKLTQHRVGIDLSPRMLEKAAARGLYDGLEAAEIVEFLGRHEESFDLIAAVDVFVYIGDLSPVFAGASRRLNQGGRFAFSVERDDTGQPFTLRNSGRFAHSAAYLQQLAEAHGYQVDLLEASTIRYEGGQPVEGYIAILGQA